MQNFLLKVLRKLFIKTKSKKIKLIKKNNDLSQEVRRKNDLYYIIQFFYLETFQRILLPHPILFSQYRNPDIWQFCLPRGLFYLLATYFSSWVSFQILDFRWQKFRKKQRFQTLNAFMFSCRLKNIGLYKKENHIF